MCTSSVQCLLLLIDNGLRGDILGMLPNISYKEDTGFFIGKFFYSILFYIIVILILGNIFLGIIVDTFADLRDRNQTKEDDIKNVCFTCGITRDQCLNRKIDFNNHRRIDHNIWNYVYFLTYVYMSNPYEFNALEKYVWDKLPVKDPSWIPVVGDDVSNE